MDVHYAPVTPVAAEVAETDHEAIRLRAGLGYFGRFESAHLLGIRYWFRRRVGFDVALGANGHSGNSSQGYATAARVALPLAYLTDKHVTLFLAPTVGFARLGDRAFGRPAVSPITGLTHTPPDSLHTRTVFSAGLRMGAELHFGFVGVQRLSLIGTFGVDGVYGNDWSRAPGPPTTRDPVPAPTESRTHRWSVATDWNAAVVYYF